MVEENYENACRLCLNCNSRNVNLFENDSYSHIISTIATCLSIEVTKEDVLPTVVCSVCMEKVQSWNSFQKLCKESQEMLQNWLRKKQRKHQESTITASTGTESQTLIDAMNMGIHIKEEIADYDIDDNSDFELETYAPDMSFKIEAEDIKKVVKEVNISNTNANISNSTVEISNANTNISNRDISVSGKTTTEYNYEDLARMMSEKACKYCSKIIPFNNHLLHHLRKVHYINIPPYMCLHCKSIMSNQRAAKSHRLLCKKKCINDPCLICKYANTNSSHTKIKYDSETTETSEYKFSCAICGKLFRTMNEWSEHRKDHGAISTENLIKQFVIDKYMCNTCSEIFLSKEEFEKHEDSHYVDMEPLDKQSDSPNLACNFLNEGSFNNSEEMVNKEKKLSTQQVNETQNTQNNSQENQNKSEKNYKCPDCSKVFYDVPSYASHRGHHTRERRINAERAESNITYTCKGCHQKFPFVTKFRRHMKVCPKLSRPNIANSKWTYKFSTLNYKKTNSKKFKYAQKSVNIDSATMICLYPQCEKKFLSSSRLYKHQVICEKRPEDFNIFRKIHPNAVQCEECKQMFISPISLGRHKKGGSCPKVKTLPDKKIDDNKIEKQNINKNNEIKTYTCDKCNQSMKNMCGLISHRKYCHYRSTSRCMECSQLLNSTAALSLHYKTKHPTRSIYCKLCNKKFYTNKGYRYHMLKHNSQNSKLPVHVGTIRCNDCERYFASKASLNKHRNYNCPKLKEKKTNDLLYVQSNTVRGISTENNKSSSTPSLTINCAVCSDTFDSISDLREHILLKHKPNIITERKKTYFCQFCKMAFNRHLDLKQHFADYHANNLKTDYPSPPVLVPAIPSYHVKNNIICSTCQLSFDDPNELESHIDAFHTIDL